MCTDIQVVASEQGGGIHRSSRGEPVLDVLDLVFLAKISRTTASVLEVLSLRQDEEDLDYTTRSSQTFGWMFLDGLIF